MPATHLISVDLPAPLSPTRAITSPFRTSKSTSVSAWTEPKLFEIPRSSSSAPFAMFLAPSVKGGGALASAPNPYTQRVLLAELCELAAADLALLQESVLEEERVIRLRDRD